MSYKLAFSLEYIHFGSESDTTDFNHFRSLLWHVAEKGSSDEVIWAAVLNIMKVLFPSHKPWDLCCHTRQSHF